MVDIATNEISLRQLLSSLVSAIEMMLFRLAASNLIRKSLQQNPRNQRILGSNHSRPLDISHASRPKSDEVN